MGKKAKANFKEVKYNISGSDLDNYLKVKQAKIIALQQATSFLNEQKKQLEAYTDIYEMFKAIGCMTDNPTFAKVNGFIVKQLEQGEKAISGTQESVAKFEKQVNALQKQYDTYFENLPVEKGKAIVHPDIITYCNIEALSIEE